MRFTSAPQKAAAASWRAAAPAAAPVAAVAPMYIGTTFGVIALGRSIGGFGNASIGTLIETSGWGAAIMVLVGIGVIGVIACLALFKFMKEDPTEAAGAPQAEAGAASGK